MPLRAMRQKGNKGKPLKAYKPAPDHPWRRSFRKNGHSIPAQSDSRVTFSLAIDKELCGRLTIKLIKIIVFCDCNANAALDCEEDEFQGAGSALRMMGRQWKGGEFFNIVQI